MTNSPIPSAKSVSALQDTVTGGAKLTVSEHAANVVKQSTTLTLTVVNINPTVVTLQIQSSRQKIQIPLEAINSSGQLHKGDVLTLTAVKGEQAKLLSQNPVSLKNQVLPEQMSRMLSKTWHDINMHDVAKAHLYPNASIKLESGSIHGNTASQLKLANNILKYGELSLHDSPLVKVTASVKNILNNGLALQIAGAPNTQLTLTSKVLSEYQLLPKDKLVLSIRQEKGSALLESIKGVSVLGDFKVTQKHLAQINTALPPSSQISLDNIVKRNMLATNNMVNRQDTFLLPGKAEITKNVAGLEQFTEIVKQHAQNKHNNESNILVSRIKNGDRKEHLIQFVVKPSVLSIDLKFLHSDSTAPIRQQMANLENNVDVQLSRRGSDDVKQNNTKQAHLQNSSNVKPLKLLAESLFSKLPSASVPNKHEIISSKLQNEIRALLGKADNITQGSLNELNTALTGISGKAPKILNTQIHDALQKFGKLHLSNPYDGSAEKIGTDIRSGALTEPKFSGNTQTTNGHIDAALLEIEPHDIKSHQSSLLTDKLVNQAINAPKPPSTMMDALINLLVLRLLPQTNAPVNIQQHIAQMMMVKTPLQQTAKASVQNSNRQNTDLESLDTNKALLKGLSNVLNQKSLNALRSAETSIQSQDSLYFGLPNLLNPSGKDIELKIYREGKDNPNKDVKTNQHWKLDMKLDIGKQGEILAKTNLSEQHMKLSFYASSEPLENTVKKHLPQLLRRLNSLGISVAESNTYVAKIPKTLMHTQLSTMKTYA